MSEELLVVHCSPTLAGMKTGSLFCCRPHTCKALEEELNRLNQMLNPRGVYLYILRENAAGTLVYVFRPKQLSRDFSRPQVNAFLKEQGYQTGNVTCMVAQLSMRLCRDEGFPHEIGLFLGYPLADVQGFIRNKGRNCKYCGYWKVYDQEEQAKKLFCRYQKCTRVYCQKLREGLPLLRLTVTA